jgi:glycosyltransferase involved in cell wall biosynthesis
LHQNQFLALTLDQIQIFHFLEKAMRKYHLLLLEPYDTGSHAAWLRGYQRASRHDVRLLTLPGAWWQWRMQGGAISLARLFMESDLRPDLIIASDMLDLTTFLALTRPRTAHLRTAVYFHENQLTYPPGPRIKRDLKLGFINYASALSADWAYFNSAFHRTAFLEELPRLLRHYPDYNELQTVGQIAAKSSVLPVGMDLARFDAYTAPKPTHRPVILWNHRWEYDKGPEVFLKVLFKLADSGVDFGVILAGEKVSHTDTLFESARERLGARVLHFGYAPDFPTYARLLWAATHAVSTAYQDFFGISTCEAIYCGCVPILPRRLNYPDLIPTAYHGMCLYNEGELFGALLAAFGQTAPPALREHVAGFDWGQLAPHYDATFEGLIEAP